MFKFSGHDAGSYCDLQLNGTHASTYSAEIGLENVSSQTYSEICASLTLMPLSLNSLCKISCSCSFYYLPSCRRGSAPITLMLLHRSIKPFYTCISFLQYVDSYMLFSFLYPGWNVERENSPFTETGNHHFVSLVTCLVSV
jgi:hypothetical protein